MFRLSAVSREIERRARRFCGLRWASIGCVTGALLSLVAAGLCRLEVLPLHWPSVSYVVVLLPASAGMLFYLFGFRRPTHLPRLLLKVDHSLQTGEKLSSLYELRQRGGRNVFRDRIERNLERQAFPWRKGLSFNWRRSSSFALGGAVLTALALLIIFPSTSSSSPPGAFSAPPSEAGDAYSPTSSSSPSQIRPGETAAPPTSSSQAQELPIQRLEDPLSEIWNTPASEGSLLEEEADLSGLMEEQRRLSEQLSELLSQIQERLEQQKQEQGEGGLTQAERQAIMALLPQIGQSDIQEALESLLEETDPEALEEYLEQAQNLAQGLTPPEELAEDTERGDDSSPRESEGEPEEQTFSWEMVEQQEEESGGESPETSLNDPEQGPAGGEEEEEWRLGNEEDQSGGTGTEEREDQETTREELPDFVQEELTGTVGSQGRFQDFITKGVPLEADPGTAEAATSFFVDYEMLRAILEGRAIPQDAHDTIRDYFQLITQGEK